jgi:2-polyprenyl-3-methyl-5-hydroxy-6-metoxy-1,4-benzoquinol methylase
MKALLRKIPAPLEGKRIAREEPCRICNENTGIQFAVVDYWDIKTSGLVKCPTCNHIQLDPMLNEPETARGCLAYYIEESLRTSLSEQIKNCVRNFRRGVCLGYSLKRKKIIPRSVLELGPGSGYLSAGLQFVFPGTGVTVMDVNEAVLIFNKEQHGYSILKEIPDNYVPEFAGKFDLVIARDIIEHVTDISKVLTNVHQYLVPGGLFHFITPNGHEDVWKHYLTYILTKSPSELLINHVNYFDGKGLKEILMRKGFNPVDYFTYQFKTTLRGAGWKKDPKLMSPVSVKKNAAYFIDEKSAEISTFDLDKTKILDKWYIREQSIWITYLYSLYQHHALITMDPGLNIGHEIYGMFKKHQDF